MKKQNYVVLPFALFLILGFLFINSSSSSYSYASNDVQTNTINDNLSYTPINVDETAPVTLTEQNFESEVFESDIPVVVEFYAKWCGACKKLMPIIDELSSENVGMMKFGILEVDENPNLASEYGIDSIPRLLVFHKGKIVKDIVGYHSKNELKEILTEVCNKCNNM